MRKIMCRVLVTLFATGLCYFPAPLTAHTLDADAGDLSGRWIGYYADGTKSEYVWSIRQTGSTLSIENVGGKTAKSKGRVEGDKVFAQDFATQNGKLSADGTKITWTDGVVWKNQPLPILAESGLAITKTAVNRNMFGRSTKRVRLFRSKTSGVRPPSRKDAWKAIKFLRKTLPPKTESCRLTAQRSLGQTVSFGRSNKLKLHPRPAARATST